MSSVSPSPRDLAYRGEDRRRVAGPVQSPFGRPFVLAVLVIVAATVALVWSFNVAPTWTGQARQLMHLLQTVSLVVAVAVGGIAISRWYLTGDTPALWIGVALLLYGIVRLGLAELSPLVVTMRDMAGWMSWVRPASQVVLLLLIVRAVTVVPVSARLSGLQVALIAVVGVVLASVTLYLLPPVATAIDGAAVVEEAASTARRGYSGVNQLGLVPIAFVLLAAALLWRGFRRRRWLFTWLALMFISIALGDLVRVTAPPPIESGLLGKELLRLLGLLLGLNGAVREILYTYRDHSTRLAQSEYTVMTTAERIREGRVEAEERAHEARSALAAIEGATRTLEHYRDRLPSETQSSLSMAISGEIRRLQSLVSVEEEQREIAPFSLAESLSPLVSSERARGVEVDVHVPGDAVAIGRAAATEQVLQTLFDNARRYAGGTRVTVKAQREDDWIVLRVEDRGPGVRPDEREAIFRRGVRGDSAMDIAGSGLGLYVAAKVTREQDGELWVDERPGGGASFALALPAMPSEVSGQGAVQGLHDIGQVGEGGGLSAARRRD